MRKRAILATIPQRPQPRRPSCRRLDRRCKTPLQGFARVTFGFWLRGGMGSDTRACACSWIRSTGPGFGLRVVSRLFRDDRNRLPLRRPDEGRGPRGCTVRGRSALASRHERGFLATEIGADRGAELLLGGGGGAGSELPPASVLGSGC